MTIAPALPAIIDVAEPTAETAAGTGTEPDHPDDGAAWASHLPEWRLLVAPLGGTFRAAPDPGVADGFSTEFGHIEARSDRQVIIPPWRGSIIEWLVQDGDPVSAGQPLARLLPEGAE